MKTREKHSGNTGKKQTSSQFFARDFAARSGEWEVSETRKPQKNFKHAYLEFKRGFLDDELGFDGAAETGVELDDNDELVHANAPANPVSH
ncbi:hypothetical protein BH11PSE11_BH11PSE11_16250 [soil metagenome]